MLFFERLLRSNLDIRRSIIRQKVRRIRRSRYRNMSKFEVNNLSFFAAMILVHRSNLERRNFVELSASRLKAPAYLVSRGLRILLREFLVSHVLVCLKQTKCLTSLIYVNFSSFHPTLYLRNAIDPDAPPNPSLITK